MNLKHFTFLTSSGANTLSGQKRHILIDQAGNPVLGFDMYYDYLIEHNTVSTTETYCKHLARFFDYLAEVSELAPSYDFNEERHKHVTALFLRDVIGAYPKFLQAGEHNSSILMSQVAKNLNRKPLQPSSLSPITAAINVFLELSEVFKLRLLEMQELGEDVGLISDEALFPTMLKKTETSQRERVKINSRSMLAGVVSGGAKLHRISTLKAPTVKKNDPTDKDFPSEEFVHFIENGFTNFRDKALYSLAGAAGLRPSEPELILFSDLNFETQEVFIVDPKTRPLSDYNYYLTAQEKDALEFKGRATKRTLLIEPWGAMFWHYLNLYLEHEYVPTDKHPFVFQKIHRNHKGEPFFETDDKTKRDNFKDAVKRANISVERQRHGLRHMYGVFLRNYYPNDTGGFGLPETTVQKVMGHLSIDSTLIYARLELSLMRTRHKLALLMNAKPDKIRLQAHENMLREKLHLVSLLIRKDELSESENKKS
ncbi:tyrosine-type recombinase/integrase [Vibrio campbellii]|uniref:tyrosine-type recombinase/integrase n=1 Tax=Vibrio campbellii TaxID=680 RepID=UPI001F36FD68|nr:tyrosine-type recombinase/integrase [Vibrio campbellii]MCE7729355.1 site-specific integrase [Vibrio campbellii]